MQKCDVCKEWGTEGNPHIHLEEEVEGLLEQIDIEKSAYTARAEMTDLVDGLIVYRYVWSPADLFKIASSQLLASLSKCICINCIKYSLSFTPHYGDGAYCTYNEKLKTETPRVIHTHGIDIREMNYRAIIRIRDVSKFKKFNKTAGVIKSIPLGQELYEKDLVFTDENTVKVINFQKWDGTKWIDVLLEDLKEVS